MCDVFRVTFVILYPFKSKKDLVTVNSFYRESFMSKTIIYILHPVFFLKKLSS